jgi:RNA polymerase sigma-70 factor (ECF subfamily)
MRGHGFNPKVMPFEAQRRVNRSRPAQSEDASFWIDQIQRVAAHQDVGCFMCIYDHYAPRVHRYLLGLGVDRAHSEELVQETLLRVWRHAAQFDGDRAGLPTWLFRIARNLYVDHLRQQRHIRVIDDSTTQLELLADAAAGPDAFADHAGLERAIDELPADQARLIRMSYLESKSHSEIATELGLPLGTVKSTLRRSFEKLRMALGFAQ